MAEGDERPMDRVPDPTAVTGKELAKSRETRRRIVEAATACLAEEGYANFSTGQVAARAGLTRPAMLYHFGSRRELLAATIAHLTRRRSEMFAEAMMALDLPPSHMHQAHRAAAVEVGWAQLETPEFAAFTELLVAARTDPELAGVVAPALAAFDQDRRETTERALPLGSFDRNDVQLARDVVRFLTEGVKHQNSIVENRDARLEGIRHFLKMLVASTPGNEFLQAVREDWRRTRGDGAAPFPGTSPSGREQA
jgi:AcrR family transcriptional regulator